jgi:filamentous hemagglutinin family protein
MIWRNQTKRVGFQLARGVVGVFSLGIAFLSHPAFAQIVPDATLGSEGSQVTPGVNVGGSLGDRIDGGAVRGSSLFHSFSEFNVNNGQRAYFADPAGIDNIFSRVTGSNVSNILGTLGVEGAANLFLLNPNGILFGQNARLDIQGSFVAITGDRFVFPGGEEFGASNPQAPPLLTMSVPVGVQYGAPAGRIINEGNLRVGQDLTLAGGTLDLQGQLQAGRDLTLLAQDTVRVRDSATDPFRAAAGGTLLVQGNQWVDIVALSHPNSGLFSGGDMVLRSANLVGGDIHYWSGGNFRIETLDGDLGDLFSPGDPVIRASGDVSFDSYKGASLHILAGGSVTITGNVTITGADTVGNSIAETVTLSDGKKININGSTEPTLDIRAGTTAIGTPDSTEFDEDTFTPNPPNIGVTGTSADITIASVDFDTEKGGTVFLTNQYNPNSLPSPNGITVGAIDTGGDSGGGSVWIDSRTNIKLNSWIITSAFKSGSAGDIKLLAGGNVTTNGSLDTSARFTEGDSGDVNLLARGGNITLNGYIDTSSVDSNIYNSFLGTPGNVILKAGGDITLQPEAKIRVRGLLSGYVTIISDTGNITFTNNNFIDSESANDNKRDGFTTVKIEATQGSVFLNSAKISAQNTGSAFAGDILIDASDRIDITNSEISGNGNLGRIFMGMNLKSQTVLIDGSHLTTTNSVATGVDANQEIISGNIDIHASDEISILNSTLQAQTTRRGDAGLIFLITDNGNSGRVSLDKSTIFNNVEVGGIGNGGLVEIKAGSLSLTNGTQIQTLVRGETESLENPRLAQGNAGNISINVSGDVSLDNSSIFSSVEPGGIGNGGLVEIKAGSLFLTNNASVQTQVGRQRNSNQLAQGNAGNVSINVSGDASVDHSSIFSSVEQNGQGNAGSIWIEAGSLSLTNGARLDVNNQVKGNAGDITLDANRVTLNNQAEISAKTIGGDGGDITITATDLLLLRNGSKISTSAGTETTPGNGGRITINAEDGFVIAVPSENSNIVANAFGGRGGVITINTNRILGLKPENRVTTRDALMNIINNPPSQISAGSDIGLEGTIEINTLLIDPSHGLSELPIEVIDPRDQIATGCGATGGTTANRQSEFVVTGRGGLPPEPDDLQTPGTLSPDWVTRDLGNVSRADIPDEPLATDSPDTLVEAQGMFMNANGELILAAQVSTATPDQSGVSPQFCSPVGDRR